MEVVYRHRQMLQILLPNLPFFRVPGLEAFEEGGEVPACLIRQDLGRAIGFQAALFSAGAPETVRNQRIVSKLPRPEPVPRTGAAIPQNCAPNAVPQREIDHISPFGPEMALRQACGVGVVGY